LPVRFAIVLKAGLKFRWNGKLLLLNECNTRIAGKQEFPKKYSANVVWPEYRQTYPAAEVNELKI